jgi:hypothetical protein
MDLSENKRKRGKPKKTLDNGDTFNEWVLKMGLSNNKKSERLKINYFIAVAQGALEDENGNNSIDGEFDFIIAVNDNLEIVCFKRTILQELGRLEDEEVIKGVARVICKSKLSTDDAITYIRQFRTTQKQGDEIKLAQAIASVIDDYTFKHVGVDLDLIESSLTLVFNAFSEKFSKNTN